MTAHDPDGKVRLGSRQRDLLAYFASIRCALVAPDAVSRSLVAKGLLTAEADGSFARLNPAGLRVIADEMEAGRIKGFSPRPTNPSRKSGDE